MKPIKLAIAFTVVIAIVLLSSSFVINEGENAFILRLGKIVSINGAPIVLQPGLHVKLPFLDYVRVFDTRIQELATPPSQPLTVVTKEQTYLLVEYFAKWRITQLAKFYTSTGGGNVVWATTLLEQRINDIVRAEYGKRTSSQAIATDRAQMMQVIRDQVNSIGKDQGIEVVDVRIQQITLPKDVMDSVFKRMAMERKQFAEAKRAEGLEKSEEIKALADQKATVIRAEALKAAAQIRAKGDREAAQLAAKAYSGNPSFYAFYRSLQAYTNSFNQKTDVLVLRPEGQFFTYFHGTHPTHSEISKK